VFGSLGGLRVPTFGSVSFILPFNPKWGCDTIVIKLVDLSRSAPPLLSVAICDRCCSSFITICHRCHPSSITVYRHRHLSSSLSVVVIVRHHCHPSPFIVITIRRCCHLLSSPSVTVHHRPSPSVTIVIRHCRHSLQSLSIFIHHCASQSLSVIVVVCHNHHPSYVCLTSIKICPSSFVHLALSVH
jgi:hypothetical protein